MKGFMHDSSTAGKAEYHSLELLSQLSRVLNIPGKELHETLNEICTILQEQLPIDGVGIWTTGRDDKFLSIIASSGLSERYLRYVNKSDRVPREGGMTGSVLRERTILVIDALAEFKLSGTERWTSMLIEEGVISMIALPIFMRSDVIGTFEVYYHDSHIFTPDERLFFEVLSNQIAVVIANNTQYEIIAQNAKKLHEEIENMIHVQKLTQLLNLYLYDSLDIALASITEYFRLKFTTQSLAVFRVSNDGKILELIASNGLTSHGAGFYKKHGVQVEDDTLISLAFRSRDPKISNHVLTDERIGKDWKIAMSIEQQIAMGAFPLVVEQHTLGVLVSFYEHIHDFPDEELSVLNTFAQFFAVALEQAETFQRLTGERQKTESMVNAIEDGLLVYDLEGRIVNANPRLLHMLNLSASVEFVGKNPHDASLDSITLLAPILQISRSTIGLEETKEIILTSPRNVIVHVREVPLNDGEGNKVGVMRIVHDVTAERTAELLKSNFVATASHQLRTPLTGVKWGLLSLGEGFGPNMTNEQKEIYDRIVAANNDVILLVNTLLDTAKMEDNAVEYHLEKTDMVALCQRIIAECQSYVNTSGLIFETEIPSTLPFVMGDIEKLHIAIWNLADNAMKYTSRGGKVKLSAKLSGDFIVIEVADNGIGIPEKDAPLLFNKFYRAANAAHTQTSGSGLGLFMAKYVIDRHNGTLVFASTEGKGTTFTASFPITKGEKV